MTGEAPQPSPPRLELSRVAVAGHAPLDLVVHETEMVAVLGEDSSSLLWTIAGLGPPVPGEVLVDGRRIEKDQPRPPGLALIPQGGALATLLTALENVLLPLADRRAALPATPVGGTTPPEDLAGTARQALDAVGLADFADHLIEDLSGGQQQRVAVARAIAGRPRLLLADQATTDLDAGNRTRVVGLLRGLAAAGAAVVLTSDDPAVVAACDRTVVLEPQA